MIITINYITRVKAPDNNILLINGADNNNIFYDRKESVFSYSRNIHAVYCEANNERKNYQYGRYKESTNI